MMSDGTNSLALPPALAQVESPTQLAAESVYHSRATTIEPFLYFNRPILKLMIKETWYYTNSKQFMKVMQSKMNMYIYTLQVENCECNVQIMLQYVIHKSLASRFNSSFRAFIYTFIFLHIENLPLSCIQCIC